MRHVMHFTIFLHVKQVFLSTITKSDPKLRLYIDSNHESGLQMPNNHTEDGLLQRFSLAILQVYDQHHFSIEKKLAICDPSTRFLFFFFLILSLPYLLYPWAFSTTKKLQNCKGLPPEALYALPFLGDALSIAWDMPGFINSIM